MRRGWLVNPTVDLIILLIGVAILLIYLFPGVFDIITGAEDILETETVKVTVDKAMLERLVKNPVHYSSAEGEGRTYSNVQRMLDSFAEMPARSMEKRLEGRYYPAKYENSKYRWAFAKLVADRLHECAIKTAFKADSLTEILAVQETNPTLCKVCYNIHVAPDARDMLESPIGSIGNFGFFEWLTMYSPDRKESYYDVLLSGFRFPEGLPLTKQMIAAQDNIDYILSADPEDDIAVVFVHVPMVSGQWVRIPGVYGKSDNIDFVSLYSYKNLADTVLLRLQRDLLNLGISSWEVEVKCGR